MDANLQRPCQLADRGDWTLGAGAAWDADRRLLRLVGARTPTWTEDATAGAARVATAPGAIDRYGTRARVDQVAGTYRVQASGAAAGEVTIVTAQPTAITDLAVGQDDVLYLAMGAHVRMHDLRNRWPDVDVAMGAFVAWRLAAAAGGGVHVVSAPAAGAIAGRIVGAPLRPIPYEFSPGVFRPVPEDPDPPRFVRTGGADVPAGVTAAAIATSPSGRLALLAWPATGDAQLRVFDTSASANAWSAPITLAGTTRPYSLTWVAEDRVAVLVATAGGGTAVGVYPVPAPTDPITAATVSPVGDVYPLRTPTAEPFLHGLAVPPRYASQDPSKGVIGSIARALLPVSWPSFVGSGTATATTLVDGQKTGVTWHRIYLEAAIPPGTSVKVWLAASDRRDPPAAADWFEHRFGDASDAGDDVPRGAWLDDASELPYAAALLPCPPRPGIAGLFTALVQRAGRRVRKLVGRYLSVKLELTGDGRSTPEVAAVRVYANRRGYAGLYLPELYREDTFGADADAVAPPTQADFLDRLLGTFESVMTPLEDRIASAWLLTAPKTVPDGSLDWLASWLGFVFAADLPAARRRLMLEHAAELYQQRGTLPGLQLALDLATGGAVTRGEVVVVEDFRLRRTFATILGAELVDPNDPLTPGLDQSGNSLVGKTLFLGQPDQRAFLALFDPDLPIGDAKQIAADEAAIDAFFERLAHRVTVLVHLEMEAQDLGLLSQIIALEAPAHVLVKVVTADYRFRVAVSSLVGVDTFLAPKDQPGPVVLDRSQVGVRDLIARLPSLDPRLGRSS